MAHKICRVDTNLDPTSYRTFSGHDPYMFRLVKHFKANAPHRVPAPQALFHDIDRVVFRPARIGL